MYTGNEWSIIHLRAVWCILYLPTVTTQRMYITSSMYISSTVNAPSTIQYSKRIRSVDMVGYMSMTEGVCSGLLILCNYGCKLSCLVCVCVCV